MEQILKPRPGPNEPSPSVLVVLDVDGVLNRFRPGMSQRPGRVQVADTEGDRYWIDADQRVLRAIDELVRRPEVALGWLTTWSTATANLVTDAFGGRLAGGYVIAGRPPGRYVPAAWKLDALAEHLSELGGDVPLVWADDDAVAAALAWDEDFAQQRGVWTAPRLLFDCDPRQGLRLGDVERIAAFVDEHVEAWLS